MGRRRIGMHRKLPGVPERLADRGKGDGMRNAVRAVLHGKRAQARRMAAPRPQEMTVYGKILSIFCFMVSAVKGLTM